MKLGILSDLHLEFAPYYFEPEPDVFYINAGDTHPQALTRDYFHKIMGENYFYIYGNHDYYGGSFKNAEMDVFSKCVNGLKIVGATLWTDITPTRWFDFKQYMVDGRTIKDLTYDRYMMTYRSHHDFLFNSNADIWVVHHLPSFQSIHPKYKDSGGNDFFASELSDKILDMKNPPKLIIHGHTHDKCDYMIGNTRVLCHPRGYPNENSWFKDYQPLIIEM